ncbi:hypothetical protein [Streptomyces sp. NEAU-YJ-81]|uniref:hypothetical protein n=1 Tax=Streptomyces sp. NEAU-YJ-81 TaxID=2820288 RepID=UPI001ABC18AC|nr:hypothetical protein [Streptomyces sp. NEAU-YJ-81]MBO3679676.1 hypothetical protein [Streptomyces sp. NEAU-YJ-81]
MSALQTPTTRAKDLDVLAGPEGTFAIVALDQRNTLRRMFTAIGQDGAAADLRAFKHDVVASLSPSASGFLLDPDFGVPAAVADGAAAESCGILVACEPAERQKWNGEPRPGRDPQLNAAWVTGMGGHAVKFFVQMRPDRPRATGEPDLIAEALDVVREVIADCRAAGIPSIIENLIYPIPGAEELSAQAKADAVVEAARLLNELQPDLLKLEYPGTPEDTRRIADAVSVPWAVLSAGVPFEQFQEVLKIACDEGGASGFIGGRAIWREAVGMDPAERQTFLAETGRRRLDECIAAIDGRAVPWRSVVGE